MQLRSLMRRVFKSSTGIALLYTRQVQFYPRRILLTYGRSSSYVACLSDFARANVSHLRKANQIFELAWRP
jgi:hypothetical protein